MSLQTLQNSSKYVKRKNTRKKSQYLKNAAISLQTIKTLKNHI